MFTYTLAIACFLLALALIKGRMLIYFALFIAWGGVIYILAKMSGSQDISYSEPLQYVAGIIMLWALLQVISARKGSNQV